MAPTVSARRGFTIWPACSTCRSISFFDDFAAGGRQAAASAFGFAESQDAFGLSPDLLSRRETIDLVSAFWRIPDTTQRRRLLDLIKGMAQPGG